MRIHEQQQPMSAAPVSALPMSATPVSAAPARFNGFAQQVNAQCINSPQVMSATQLSSLPTSTFAVHEPNAPVIAPVIAGREY